jgi:1,4-dihydroxy-2-naphthoate octaprenyltransferase
LDNRQPNFFQLWFQAIRFPSLTASLIPVMLGGGFAIMDRAFNGKHFLLALVGGMLVQAGANLFNDYFDYRSGADNADSLFGGNVIQQGLLSPRQVYLGGVVSFAAALLIGLYFVMTVGFGILWFGLTGLLLAYFYTGGPYPLAYRALGELVVFYAMGPFMVLGAYFVQVGTLRSIVFLGAVPIGLLVASTLYANNLRDRDLDRLVGKRTIANLLSETSAKKALSGLIYSAYLIQIILTLSGLLPWFSLLTLLTVPLAYNIVRKTWQSSSPLELNLVLGLTVLLHLLYGIAYTLGLFFSTWFI